MIVVRKSERRLIVPFMQRYRYDREQEKVRVIAFAMAEAAVKKEMLARMEDPEWTKKNCKTTAK